jgi:membrane-associated phospholipid phosphatase
MTRRPLSALIAALACLGAGAVVWALAFQSAAGARLDAATLSGFLGLPDRLEALAHPLAHLGDPLPFAMLSAALICIALARGRPRLALMAGVVLVGANVTTQLLKIALAEPRHSDLVPWWHNISAEAFPSGHATASMTVALCLVAVVPPRARPLAAAAGAVFTLGVVYSLLVLGWHYPSDVLGGFFVAAAWTLAGLAAVGVADRRWPAGAGRDRAVRFRASLRPPALAAAGLVVLAVLAALARPEEALAYAEEHPAFVAGAAAIGAAALALAAALAAALRSD